MGQTASVTNRVMFAPEDIPLDNGYILANKSIPYELLALILSYVSKESLSHRCKLVCKLWYEVINDEVWKIKAEREYLDKLKKPKPQMRLPTAIYKKIVCKNPYGKNLLRNNTGRNNLKDWDIILNGGNAWNVEKPPIGVKLSNNKKADGPPVAFVTSYAKATKEQVIDLIRIGFDSEILDYYQPHVVVSEQYAARWDCGSTYNLSVTLLDNGKNPIDSFEFQKEMDNWRNGWEQVNHTFKEYGTGLRYIVFSHSGQDNRFWAGHYGAKMADASLSVCLEYNKSQNSCSSLYN